MSSPYKRRKPSIVKNLWIYRWVVVSAMVLGLMLWFIWANGAPVKVAFPFGLGSLESSLGLVILLSALVGSIATALLMTVYFALKKRQTGGPRSADEEYTPLPDDRPPSDYAARASETPPEGGW